MKFALPASVKKLLLPAHDGARHGLTHVCVCLALLSAWTLPRPETVKPIERARAPRIGEHELDAALQRAATDALGARDGTIIVMDAQTGRVRAAVNPQTAETAFPPGSAIKPFTLLAALRARVINSEARLSCRKHYARRGADFTCSHPVYNPPFNSAQALAHSCNYYFARLAERLPAEDFNRLLAAYNFGTHASAAPSNAAKTTQTTARAQTIKARFADETTMAAATPRIPRGAWQLGTALGEGDELLTTPLQLLAAYAALFNGGHLYRTQFAAPEEFRAEEIAAGLAPAPDERALLLAGLRGAIRYGTASASDLAPLPTHVFGKTGTATESASLHTHGWFVGFAAEREPAKAGDALPAGSQATDPAPTEVKLAVLVFLRRGQGKQSAELARPVFAAHARLTAADTDSTSEAPGTAASSPAAGDYRAVPRTQPNGATTVRVRLTRAETTRSLALDDYLFGALAAESSVEDEFAALKAQAVVSRTYALANLRRHARDGYDFCDTTHCQRFIEITRATARPDFHELVRRAVADTAGEVLRDARGALASDVFFSTSCGGRTANIQTLWGTPAREPYLRGVRDDYCNAMPHTRWTDAVPAAQLARALREDTRTDVGARIDSLSVVRRDATGRAEQIAISGGGRRVVVRGWDFKIVVGRTLGWSVLKSSRFNIERAGDKFVFRGSGFGHGLGLCQSGAHVMATRGSSYRQILAYYFPATTVGAVASETSKASHTQPANAHARARASHEKTAIENAAATNAVFKRVEFVPAKPARTTLTHDAAARPASAGAGFTHADFAHASFAHASAHASPLSPVPVEARLSLSSANFRVSYPARGARREVEAALAVLETAQRDVRARLAAASLAAPSLGVWEAFVHATTGDFTGATGKPAWVAATTVASARRIELQPLATLNKRGILTQTLRHEYAHAVIYALGRGRAPLWLTEGLAAHVANEGVMLTRHAPREKLSLAELEKRLAAAPVSAADMRALYAAAFREVNALIRAEGEASVWRRVARG